MIDPFAGVGLGAADALAFGLNWIGKELEQRFVDMGRGCECTGVSKKDWVKCFGRWDRFRYEDGRHWCPHCVAEAARVIEDWEPALPGMEEQTVSYRRNSGQIPHTDSHHYTGNLELFAKFSRNGAQAVLLQGDSRNLVDVLDGARAKGIVASPPFINSLHKGQSGTGVCSKNDERNKNWEGWEQEWGVNLEAYGQSPGQLAAMREGDHVKACISSPPWQQLGANLGDVADTPGKRQEISEHSHNRSDAYGRSEGQLAAMPEGDVVKACISSPPFESSDNRGGTKMPDNYFNMIGGLRTQDDIVPNSLGQLGQEQGSTFWEAARVIVSQCHQVLAPGGVAIFVTKRFVRDKQIVEFSQQWADLCESVGFELIEWIRAWLVEDRGTQYTLDGKKEKREVKRMSFFRRLHTQKYPHLAIEWEDVLCFRKGGAIDDRE